MCTGEVERKVWMRRRSAGLIASAQRSMSLNAARDSPQITAFLVRLAISWTAAKSPSDAIGKPASMMSTPIVVEQFGDFELLLVVMVAPGHCSPSRKVVSKMTTRSFSDWVWRGHGVVLFVCARRTVFGILWALVGFRCCGRPLSAQAQTPSRPSGGAKEQEPANNEGSAGRSLQGSPGHRAEIAAIGHCWYPRHALIRSRIKVNSALTPYGTGLF